jgi:hypothetical protein
MHIYDKTSLSSSWNEKCFSQELQRKSKHTFYVQYPPPPNNCAVYKIMWKFMVNPEVTDNSITLRRRIACWITKATDTHSEYVILIAYPRQQWLHEEPSMLLLPGCW